MLQRLREHDIYAKRAKCAFNQPELEFLGHIVGCEGIKIDPRKTAVVRDWAVPQNLSELRLISWADSLLPKDCTGLC